MKKENEEIILNSELEAVDTEVNPTTAPNITWFTDKDNTKELGVNTMSFLNNLVGSAMMADADDIINAFITKAQRYKKYSSLADKVDANGRLDLLIAAAREFAEFHDTIAAIKTHNDKLSAVVEAEYLKEQGSPKEVKTVKARRDV